MVLTLRSVPPTTAAFAGSPSLPSSPTKLRSGAATTAQSDDEILNAVRPGLATTGGPLFYDQ